MSKNLSKFVFKKLIYDYLTDFLSGEELEKFKLKLDAEKDCFDEVEMIKKGMSYMAQVNKIQISNDLLAELKQVKEDPVYFIKNPIEYKWPKSLRRSFMAINLCLLTGLTYILVPWNNLPNFNWPSFQNIQNHNLRKQVPKVEILEGIRLDEQLAGFYKISDDVLNSISKIKVASREKVNKEELDPVVKSENSSAVSKTTESLNKFKSKPHVKTKGPQGTLFRAYMSLHDLNSKTMKISNMIIKLGGEKAGKTNFGYKKPKGRYFHLKLPSGNKDTLMSNLNDLGLVKIDKEKHWRRMDDGVSRIIIWVEDLDLKAKRLSRR